MNILEAMKKIRLYFVGGTGTELIARGLASGKSSESALFEHPDWVVDIHRSYIDAGANIIKANTFGVNSLKYENYNEYIRRGIELANEARGDREGVYIALDMGPLGRMLKPFGDLEFDRAIQVFANTVRATEGLSVDLILIETMNDSYETKAAVLAAKENSDLPIFVTNVYDGTEKTITGSSPEVMATMLEGLGVAAIGANCSFGPKDMIPVARSLISATNLPIIINPNAGIPRVVNGETLFDEDPESFSDIMVEMCDIGVSILGGCCGTTPEHIRLTRNKTVGLPVDFTPRKTSTKIASSLMAVNLDAPLLIGERINPTGKKKLKEALYSDNFSLILSEAIKQEEMGVSALDVNCGLPNIDEKAKMRELVEKIQAVVSVPLQIDSGNAAALESAMRCYNGKPLVNSTNGSDESMNLVMPLVKKYGGMLVALTMDESGIPETAEGRVAIAKRILERANSFGLSPSDLIFDPLCLTVSTNESAYEITLDAVRELTKMGLNTTLGVSNVSFGMPNREEINSAFFGLALADGLSAAIMNPYSTEMMRVYKEYMEAKISDEKLGAFRVKANLDMKATLKRASSQISTQILDSAIKSNDQNEITLDFAIIKGLVNESESATEKLLKTHAPIDVINNQIIPALDAVGAAYDSKKIFLPSLIMSAEAASAAFEVVKKKMPRNEASKGKVVMATVKGDIHDIGKNIVRVVLESYGFDVVDLGRDVPCAKVLSALESGADILGLSALMTTTLPAMEETVKAVKASYPSVKIMVGGAVLTKEYASHIGADYYAKDAVGAAKIANDIMDQK